MSAWARTLTHSSPSRCTAPVSISIDNICSTYSGLPSAVLTMRPSRARGSPAAPSRFVTTCAAAARPSGRSTSRLERSRSPHCGRSSSKSWRAVASSSTGASSIVSSRFSSRSRNAGSAQWMSSNSASTGFCAARRLHEAARTPVDFVQRERRGAEPGGRRHAIGNVGDRRRTQAVSRARCPACRRCGSRPPRRPSRAAART